MPAEALENTILLVSDHVGLSRAIRVTLESEDILVVTIPMSGETHPLAREEPRGELIIAVISSPSRALFIAFRVSEIFNQLGRIPLLVISDEPVTSLLSEGAVHLPLPFNLDDLRRTVRRLLKSTP